jgi:hypothetical protein
MIDDYTISAYTENLPDSVAIELNCPRPDCLWVERWVPNEPLSIPLLAIQAKARAHEIGVHG